MEATMNMMNRMELTDEELEMIDGAGWLNDAWKSTKKFVNENKQGLIIVGCAVAGAALCATGAGAAAGAGLLACSVSAAATAGGIAGATIGGCVVGVAVSGAVCNNH